MRKQLGGPGVKSRRAGQEAQASEGGWRAQGSLEYGWGMTRDLGASLPASLPGPGGQQAGRAEAAVTQVCGCRGLSRRCHRPEKAGAELGKA